MTQKIITCDQAMQKMGDAATLIKSKLGDLAYFKPPEIIKPTLPTNQEEFDQLDWSEVFKLEGDLSSLAEQGVTKDVDMGAPYGTQAYQLVDTDCYEKTTGGKTKMVFLSVACLTDHAQKHADSNVSTLWSASLVKTFCDTNLYNAMPADLQAAIVEVNLPCFTSPYTYNSGTCPSLTNVKGKVFIPSVPEVFPQTQQYWGGSNPNYYYPSSGTFEGTQYKYFALHNTDADRIKKYSGSAKSWWLRSPVKGSSAWCFHFVGKDGYFANGVVYGVCAVAAGFCL